MAIYHHAEHPIHHNVTSTPILQTLSGALGVILAIGILGQVAGDWTESAAERMSHPDTISDWRGNSASLTEAR